MRWTIDVEYRALMSPPIEPNHWFSEVTIHLCSGNFAGVVFGLSKNVHNSTVKIGWCYKEWGLDLFSGHII